MHSFIQVGEHVDRSLCVCVFQFVFNYVWVCVSSLSASLVPCCGCGHRRNSSQQCFSPTASHAHSSGAASYSRAALLLTSSRSLGSSIMFAANKILQGVLNVVSGVDINQFLPSDPHPPRMPHVFAEHNESPEEKQFRKVFQQLAGDDMEVSPTELKDILNKIVAKHCDLKTDGFSIESCRSMVAVMDGDSSGKLGFHEFKILWNNIKKWQGIYKKYDADRSGTISVYELSGALKAAGFQFDDNLYQLIVRRYSDESGNMDFDNYIAFMVRLDAMCRAFQTLDKDRDGTIQINIQEVKRLHFLN
uniref:Calpain small subunit 1 n=1 Tax=Scleropages formosus TaxID=113540 RepID=A0A8C9W3G9_SCLFO